MGLFSAKKDSKYIKEFDIAKENLEKTVDWFREQHFDSVILFNQNWSKNKSPADLEKERKAFEASLETLDKMKQQTDILVKEASKLLRFENIMTSKDKEKIKRLSKPD